MNKKKTCSLEQKISNSKLDIIKKSLLFMIAPIVILLVGVILFVQPALTMALTLQADKPLRFMLMMRQKLQAQHSMI